jgi:hypothetical protein
MADGTGESKYSSDPIAFDRRIKPKFQGGQG